MRLKSLLFLFIVCILYGCNDKYDDSDLWKSLNDIKGRVETLETVQRAYQNKLTIETIITTEDGYRITFSDGTFINIINDKPVIIPEDKDTCYISSIEVKDTEVIFYLTDGSSFSIELTGAIEINFKESTPITVIQGQNRILEFNVESNIEETDVEVLSSGDLKARILDYDKLSGKGSVEVFVDHQVDRFSKIVLIANNGRRVAMKRIEFSDEGIGIFNNTQKQTTSEGGLMELEFVSSVETKVVIPEHAQSWIKVAPVSRSAQYNCVNLELEPNTGAPRSADVTVQSLDGSLYIVFHVRQEAEYGLINTTEYEALCKIFEAYGDSYTDWKMCKPENWLGVVLDSEGYVSELTIFYFDGTKALPREIGALKHLKKLDLSHYPFSSLPEELALCEELEVLRTTGMYGSGTCIQGNLPQCVYKLTNLKELTIQNHGITAIDSKLADLTNLEVLELSGNNLKTFDFQSLPKLKKLRKFDCRINYQLIGSLPENIGDLRNLEEFRISYCKLSGDLPDSFWKLTNLKVIDIAGNNLNPIHLPASIGYMKSLRTIALSYITILGGLPNDIGSLNNLEELILESCNLTGTIPESICNAKNLRDLTLFNNQLTGEIPSKIVNLNLYSLNLAINKLTGTIPAGMGKFMDLWLYRNNLTGDIPDDLLNSSMWRNGWGKIYCENNLNYNFRPFPGPDKLDMTEDTASLIPYDFSAEYNKHKYTILFQFTDRCAYFTEALNMLKTVRSKYSPEDVFIVGRTFSECAGSIQANGMTWPVYFSQQLDYPYYVVPTITVFDNRGYLVFSDMIQNRFDLPEFIAKQMSDL